MKQSETLSVIVLMTIFIGLIFFANEYFVKKKEKAKAPVLMLASILTLIMLLRQ